MFPCQAKLKSGNQCKYQARDDGFCKLHTKKNDEDKADGLCELTDNIVVAPYDQGLSDYITDNEITLVVDVSDEEHQLENLPCESIQIPIEDKTTITDEEMVQEIIKLDTHLNDENAKVLVCSWHSKMTSSVLLVGLLLFGYNQNLTTNQVLATATDNYEHVSFSRAHKRQIRSLLKPYDFYSATKSNGVLANTSQHRVRSKRFETEFQTAVALFEAYKKPDDLNYIDELKKRKTPKIVFNKSKDIPLPEDWEDKCYEYMLEVLNDKYNTNQFINNIFDESGIAPLYHHTKNDRYWGDGADRTGQNMLGKAWAEIRRNTRLQ